MRAEKRKKAGANPDITHLDNLDDTAEREGQGDNDEEAGEQSDQEGTKSWSLVASWNGDFYEDGNVEDGMVLMIKIKKGLVPHCRLKIWVNFIKKGTKARWLYKLYKLK